ncbi:SPOR domain-containing protein [Acidithiobacillus ferrooxidans F221]|uniref:SPOR domain-containing protein n=1 Tax=Acidithiobacillus ferrooxidans TaxID=920 RepID=UPI001C072D45|nr:SPOR domain-containing protein [Acidithiobacillus ferrooxidans]MBU2808517.1 SPOR domain-containing protein [Acidithiobacillus ferrooxidans F221]
MRDYKNQTSRPQVQEPRPPIPPRQRATPEDDAEETPSPRARHWPWMLLLLVIALSAGVWWWIAQLPIATGRPGLSRSGTGPSTAATSRNNAATTRQKPPDSPATTTRPSAPVPISAAALSARGGTPTAATSAAASTTSTAATRSGVDFNFYRILPAMHVDIPADILGSGPGIPSAATASSTSAVHQPVTIQVGAFTNRAAAVVLRDRLALLGVSTQMEKAEAGHNSTLYRLRTNTFDSLAAAQPTLAKIRGMGITPLLLGSGIIGSGVNVPLSQSPAP